MANTAVQLTVFVTKSVAKDFMMSWLLLWLTCLSRALDLSLTDVLLCELLIGGWQHVCGSGLIAAQRRVRVHRGAVQHQRPLFQLACGNSSVVKVLVQKHTFQSVLMVSSWVSIDIYICM